MATQSQIYETLGAKMGNVLHLRKVENFPSEGCVLGQNYLGKFYIIPVSEWNKFPKYVGPKPDKNLIIALSELFGGRPSIYYTEARYSNEVAIWIPNGPTSKAGAKELKRLKKRGFKPRLVISR